MVPFFVEEFWPFSEMVPFLLTIFYPFLKWYHFCWGFITLFWLKWYRFYWGFLTLFWNGTIFCWGILTFFRNGIIFVDEFLHFSEMVLFLLRIFDPFQIWYHFIEDFWPFSDLKWYYFCWGILTLFWNGTNFYWGILTLFRNGTIFVEEFWLFSD